MQQQQQATTTSSQEDDTTTTLLLDPAVVSFFMHQCEDEDERRDFSNSYDNFASIRQLVIPINDTMIMATSTTTSEQAWQIPGRGGTHWSLLLLLLVAAKEKEEEDTTLAVRMSGGYHFDSVPNSGNHSAAQDVASKFQALLLNNNNAEKMKKKKTIINVEECKVPKQSNGYDCGIHVLATAQVLLQIFNEHEDGTKQPPPSLNVIVGQRLDKLFLQTNCADFRRRIVEGHLYAGKISVACATKKANND